MCWQAFAATGSVQTFTPAVEIGDPGVMAFGFEAHLYGGGGGGTTARGGNGVYTSTCSAVGCSAVQCMYCVHAIRYV